MGSRLLSAFSNFPAFRIRPPSYVPVGCQDSFAIIVVEKDFAAGEAPIHHMVVSAKVFYP